MWKVGRYTSAAAPLYFSEADNYLDGGLLANNPIQQAWTEIHQPDRKLHLHPSLIVSIGTGVPTEKSLRKVTIPFPNIWDISTNLQLFAKLVKDSYI